MEVKNVTVRYGEITALKDLSLSVDEGEYVCLAGSNGSGKSTLLKAVLGLVPVESGEVRLSLPRSSVAWLAQQNPADRDFPATAYEVALMGRQTPCCRGSFRPPFYLKEDRRAAREAMELMGVSHLRDRRIGELSGGQLQRVLLARALCGKAKMLILDEPCAGLDPVSSEGLYECLSLINRERGATILMVTHDVGGAVRSAGRMVYINHRTVEFDGTPDEYAAFAAKAGLPRPPAENGR